jgi:uncharacterized protein
MNHNSKIIISFIFAIAVVFALISIENNYKRKHIEPDIIKKYEVFPEEKLEIDKEEKITEEIIEPLKKLPKIAIIIDDIGYDRDLANKFFTLDKNFTISVLPFSPYGKALAKKAHNMGFEIMLHLPMEPLCFPKADPGSFALFAAMQPKVLKRTLNKNLNAIPFIKGVNNHMGSKLTAIEAPIKEIFAELKSKNLFFIDSRTTYKTICRQIAKTLELPFAERDVFLDNIQEKKAVIKQIEKLLKKANEKGSAIGICHPHPATFEALSEKLIYIKEKANFVPASSLVSSHG